MYDHIVGDVVEKQPARVVLRAAGVGFELEVPTSTSAEVHVGDQVKLFVIMHVTDGVPTLLGFAERTERELARQLLGVSGVGKAMSLAILSTYAPREIATAILQNDHLALKRVKGVGAKTAERLCLELRDHVAKVDFGGEAVIPRHALPPSADDAIAALVTLGFSAREARDKTEKAARRTPEATTEDLIKTVLRG